MVVLAVMQCVTNSPSLPVPYAHTVHLARSGILRMLRVWAKRVQRPVLADHLPRNGRWAVQCAARACGSLTTCGAACCVH